jgi:hypothetical protein
LHLELSKALFSGEPQGNFVLIGIRFPAESLIYPVLTYYMLDIRYLPIRRHGACGKAVAFASS